MKELIFCEETLSDKPWRMCKCRNKPRYKLTYKDGSVKNMCGIHKNWAVVKEGSDIALIEELKVK